MEKINSGDQPHCPKSKMMCNLASLGIFLGFALKSFCKKCISIRVKLAHDKGKYGVRQNIFASIMSCHMMRKLN